MSIKTKYYYGTVGEYRIFDSELTNTDILKVTRNGTVYSQTFEEFPPRGTRFIYSPATGGIIFDPTQLFQGAPPDQPQSINALEKISVKFRA